MSLVLKNENEEVWQLEGGYFLSQRRESETDDCGLFWPFEPWRKQSQYQPSVEAKVVSHVIMEKEMP